MEIVRIQKSDLPDLSKLLEELSSLKSNYLKIERAFEQIIDNENYYLLGAKMDGQLVGSVMGILCLDLVGECLPFMAIENVIVSKDYRNRGIGKALMAEIELIASGLNCYYTFFVSGEDRKEAHKFYGFLGYDIDKVKGFKKYLIEVQRL
jgi:GNAT superfamily N-acetyltransferase